MAKEVDNNEFRKLTRFEKEAVIAGLISELSIQPTVKALRPEIEEMGFKVIGYDDI
jgi:hypothetical protein